jgi:hypothetical protein
MTGPAWRGADTRSAHGCRQTVRGGMTIGLGWVRRSRAGCGGHFLDAEGG